MATRAGVQVIAWLPKRLAARFKAEAKRQGRTHREVMAEAVEVYLRLRKLRGKPLTPNGGDILVNWDDVSVKKIFSI